MRHKFCNQDIVRECEHLYISSYLNLFSRLINYKSRPNANNYTTYDICTERTERRTLLRSENDKFVHIKDTSFASIIKYEKV